MASQIISANEKTSFLLPLFFLYSFVELVLAFWHIDFILVVIFYFVGFIALYVKSKILSWILLLPPITFILFSPVYIFAMMMGYGLSGPSASTIKLLAVIGGYILVITTKFIALKRIHKEYFMFNIKKRKTQ